jgi:hypothetical protein
MVLIEKIVDFPYQWETVQQGVVVIEAIQFHIYNVILHMFFRVLV